MSEARITIRTLFLSALLLSNWSSVPAQQLSREEIIKSLEKDGCVVLEQSKVKICKYDYSSDGNRVQAISYRPIDKGKFPGLLLIPGYQGDAMTYFPLAIVLAHQGFASLTVAQPGFGKSQGKPDFVGPLTIKALMKGFKKFQSEPYVDRNKMGILGGSRGGMAASLLAVRLKHLKAAVFASGIYDFKKAYDEIKIEGIRENMLAESGMTSEAIKQRSSILQMQKLNCPVLILHGEKDENVPVSQAILLRDRLIALRKDFEIELFPNVKHDLPGAALGDSINFLSRKIKGVAAKDLPKFR